MHRRIVLKGIAASCALVATKHDVLAASSVKVQPRLEWNAFRKKAKLLEAFRTAMCKLRACESTKCDSSNPNHLAYWTKIHALSCEHDARHPVKCTGSPVKCDVPVRSGNFLLWHRGFLAKFESKLQELSGCDELRIPYWDWLKDAKVPEEFRSTLRINWPFFQADRNQGVSCIDMDWFKPDPATHFQQFWPMPNNKLDTESFEFMIRTGPHSEVHTLLQGQMGSTNTAAGDPIFWLHHANVDRLWECWRSKGGKFPTPEDNYWMGKETYSLAANKIDPKQISFEFDRHSLMFTRDLGYEYIETDLHIAASNSHCINAESVDNRLINVVSSDDVLMCVLDPAPLSLSTRTLRLTIKFPAEFQNLMSDPLSAEKGGLEIVLGDVTLTEAGLAGGFYYLVYFLKSDVDIKAATRENRLGALTPFDIGMAAHHSHELEPGERDVMFRFHTRRWARMLGEKPSSMDIVFARIDGEHSPVSDPILIGELNIVYSRAG